MEKLFIKIGKTLLFLILLVAMSFFINKGLYYDFIKEDGWVEYLTAILLLFVSILLVIKMVKIKFTKGYQWFAFNMLMALGLFFGFGEEISWGQRIFDFTSSDFFMKNNLQEETNLHNLMLNGVNFNKLIFTYVLSILFGVYFLLLLMIYKKNKFLKNIIDNFGIPVPKIKHSVIFIITTIAIMFISDDKKWELWECLFAVILLLIFIEPYNFAEKLLITKNKCD